MNTQDSAEHTGKRIWKFSTSPRKCRFENPSASRPYWLTAGCLSMKLNDSNAYLNAMLANLATVNTPTLEWRGAWIFHSDLWSLRSETCVCVWKYMLLHLSCGVRSLPHHTLYGVREMGLLNARDCTIWKSASLTRCSRPLHEGAWKVVLSAVNAKILKLSAKIRQMKTFPETESTKRAWKCRDLALKRFEWRQP